MRIRFKNTLETKSAEDSSIFCKVEACKQAKIVLCVLSSACRLSLQISPKIQGFQSAECLEDFPLSEHQNIRKAVLCVLPKEFCVRRSEKDPMIQGLLYKVAFRINSLKLIILPRQYRIQDYSKHCRAGQSSKLNWAYFDRICVKAKSAY